MGTAGRGLGMSNKQLRTLCKTLLACAELLATAKRGWLTYENWQVWMHKACERIDEDLPDE